MSQLIFEFGIGATKAYELAVTKKDNVILQLDAWRFREVRPRNAAGWMIQAIENNYELPSSYFEDKKKQQQSEQLEAAQAARRACGLCDGTGFRRVRSAKYPNGAMRPCSHDPLVESPGGSVSASVQ
jgi:hypothetical protein